MTTTRPTFDAFLAWLEDSRRLGQVHFDEKSQCWNVLGHPETNAVLSDPAVFSSDLAVLQPAQDDFALFQRGNFVQMDPPQHRKLRTLVSQAFTPKVVAGLEPRIAELTTELLDQVGDAVRPDRRAGLPAAGDRDRRAARHPHLGPGALPVAGRTCCSARRSIRTRPWSKASEQAVAAVAPTMREMNAYFLRLHPVPAGRPRQRPDEQAGPGRGGRGAAGRRGDHRVRRAAAARRAHHDHRDAGQQRASASTSTRTPSPRSGPTRRCSRRRSRRCSGCARRSRASGGSPGRHRGGRRADPRGPDPAALADRGQPGRAGVRRARTGSTSTASPTRT